MYKQPITLHILEENIWVCLIRTNKNNYVQRGKKGGHHDVQYKKAQMLQCLQQASTLDGQGSLLSAPLFLIMALHTGAFHCILMLKSLLQLVCIIINSTDLSFDRSSNVSVAFICQ